MNGTVAFFHDRKGYGFIESDELDDDVFFHVAEQDFDEIAEGTEVEFETEEGDRGLKAANVAAV